MAQIELLVVSQTLRVLEHTMSDDGLPIEHQHLVSTHDEGRINISNDHVLYDPLDAQFEKEWNSTNVGAVLDQKCESAKQEDNRGKELAQEEAAGTQESASAEQSRVAELEAAVEKAESSAESVRKDLSAALEANAQWSAHADTMNEALNQMKLELETLHREVNLPDQLMQHQHAVLAVHQLQAEAQVHLDSAEESTAQWSLMSSSWTVSKDKAEAQLQSIEYLGLQQTVSQTSIHFDFPTSGQIQLPDCSTVAGQDCSALPTEAAEANALLARQVGQLQTANAELSEYCNGLLENKQETEEEMSRLQNEVAAIAQVYCSPAFRTNSGPISESNTNTPSTAHYSSQGAAEIVAAVTHLIQSPAQTCLQQVSAQLTTLERVHLVLNANDARIVQLQSDCQDAELERDMLASRCQQLQNKLDLLDEHGHQKNVDHDLLAAKLAAKERAEKRVESIVNGMEQRLTELRNENNTLRAQLQQQSVERKAMRQSIAQLTTESKKTAIYYKTTIATLTASASKA